MLRTQLYATKHFKMSDVGSWKSMARQFWEGDIVLLYKSSILYNFI